jgi:predicted nucleic acid binding AN1-type Zn finger protein
MRAICVAASTVVGALVIMAQSPPQQKSAPPSAAIKCKNVEGLGCTQRQVKALSDAVFEGKSKHDVLLPVKELALAASDGTLRCAQSNGTVCTTAELDIIKEIAAGQQLTIKYTSSK